MDEMISAFYSGRRHFPLMPSVGDGGAITFAVYLSSILLTKAEIIADLLQRDTIPYHGIKLLKRILAMPAVFLSKLALKFISWLDAKLVAPLGDRTGRDVKQTSDLCVTQCLSMDLLPNKRFDVPFINFQCTSSSKKI